MILSVLKFKIIFFFLYEKDLICWQSSLILLEKVVCSTNSGYATRWFLFKLNSYVYFNNNASLADILNNISVVLLTTELPFLNFEINFVIMERKPCEICLNSAAKPCEMMNNIVVQDLSHLRVYYTWLHISEFHHLTTVVLICLTRKPIQLSNRFTNKI